MELEEIYWQLEEMEENPEYLAAETTRYSNYLDNYQHTEEGECLLEEGNAVSANMIVEETLQFVRVVEAHEESFASLPVLETELRDASSHMYVDGGVLGPDDLYGRIEDLHDRYQDAMGRAMEVASRAQVSPDLPRPLTVKQPVKVDESFAPNAKKPDMKVF